MPPNISYSSSSWTLLFIKYNPNRESAVEMKGNPTKMVKRCCFTGTVAKATISRIKTSSAALSIGFIFHPLRWKLLKGLTSLCKHFYANMSTTNGLASFYNNKNK